MFTRGLDEAGHQPQDLGEEGTRYCTDYPGSGCSASGSAVAYRPQGIESTNLPLHCSAQKLPFYRNSTGVKANATRPIY